MVVDSSGYVHIAVEGGETNGIFYLTNAPSGTWTTQRLTTAHDYAPSIAMDSSGRIVIAWDRTNGGSRSYGIWTATNTGSGWVINRRYGKTAWLPSVALYNGDVALAFQGPSGKLVYRTNLSGSWTTKTIAGGGCCSGAPSLQIVAGSPEIAWSTGNLYKSGSLKYSFYAGGAWYTVTVDSSKTSAPRLVDNNGPYIVYVRTNSTAGTTLAAPAQSGWFFNTYGPGYYQWPDLAIANGTLYIVEGNYPGYAQAGTQIRLVTAPLSNPSSASYTTLSSTGSELLPEVEQYDGHLRVIFDHWDSMADPTSVGVYFMQN
jgi:hypothetical protein